MKKLISLLLMCITFTLLPGCSSVSETLSDLSQSEPVVAKSDDGVFQVELPSGWKTTAKHELNDEDNLGATKSSNDSYFMALMEKKSDFSLDLAGYKDIVVTSNAEAYKVNLDSSTPIKIGAYNGYVNEFTTTFESINCHMWIYVIETVNYYGQLFLWTKESEAAENKDEFLKIVNSFKEVPQTTP